MSTTKWILLFCTLCALASLTASRRRGERNGGNGGGNGGSGGGNGGNGGGNGGNGGENQSCRNVLNNFVKRARKAQREDTLKATARNLLPKPSYSASRHHGYAGIFTDSQQNGYIIEEILEKQNGPSPNSKLAEFCEDGHVIDCLLGEPTCDPEYPYRSADGSCNNLINVHQGRALTVFSRRDGLAPQYEPGTNNELRMTGVTGPLPSARTIREKVLNDIDIDDEEFTLLVMQWGQFIDHDLNRTPFYQLFDTLGNIFAIACCEDGQPITEDKHSFCREIEILAEDPFYSDFEVTCMDFVRSIPGPSTNCSQRDQVNEITHHLDGSMVYGSSEEETAALRDGAFMLIQTDPATNEELLPAGQDSEECPDNEETQQSCFVAGDIRVNEMLDLALMHTLWVREHNRIAQILQELGWDDEEDLFQQTRRIVVAEIQHITYNEWLPAILGLDDLRPLAAGSGYFTGYDSSVDDSIENVFAAEVLRFGHSLIQGLLDKSNEEVELRTLLFNPYFAYDAAEREAFLKGLLEQPSQTPDGKFTEQITNHLFEEHGENGTGLDLISLNIQRSRDHGIPPYNDIRESCGLDRYTNFDQFSSDSTIVAALEEVYANVDDVDGFVGGMLEERAAGAAVGETFQCILFEQFERLKLGDRFWYENGPQTDFPGAFTEEQLDSIRNGASLSRIFCDNEPTITMVSPESLFQETVSGNGRVSCDEIPQVDLNLFGRYTLG